MRIRAQVAYDGTEFAGFQKQANARTVQGELESALVKVCERQIAVSGAGRTDTGVHASGQVIAFEADWKHGLDRLVRALNINLPDDVAVREVSECDADFHPRFSAKSRTYEYSVFVSATRDPLRRRFAWHLQDMPDVARMNEAAHSLVGSHDFAAFGSAPSGRESETTVRNMIRAEWLQIGDALKFTVEANAFLYRMVRRTVMALVQVGHGQISPAELGEILESKNSQRLKGIAPACGLCLVDVKYS
jgi:tRNA pseudouridine38-40 synthase